MQKIYLLVVALLITRLLTAQTPTLVKDIYNFQNNGSIMGAANYNDVGSVVYFTAGDCINGFDLRKTDGKEGGTVMVKDNRQGQESSLPDMEKRWYRCRYYSVVRHAQIQSKSNLKNLFL